MVRQSMKIVRYLLFTYLTFPFHTILRKIRSLLEKILLFRNNMHSQDFLGCLTNLVLSSEKEVP